jgi:hypothetical protein
MTKSRRTNVTDPAAPGVDYQDAQIQYTCQSSVTNRPIEWIISGLMEAGLSGGRSPPVSWCSRVVLTVNSDAGDEGSDHLRVEQVGESDRLVAVGAGPAEVDPAANTAQSGQWIQQHWRYVTGRALTACSQGRSTLAGRGIRAKHEPAADDA